MKQTDKSFVINYGLKYDKYKLYLDKLYEEEIFCIGYKALELNNKKTLLKTEVFRDVIELGEKIYKTISGVKGYTLTLSSEIEKIMNLDDIDKPNDIILEEEFPNPCFEGLVSFISNNNYLKQEILIIIKKYGLPNFDEMFYKELDLLSTFKYDTGVSRSLKNYTSRITPFINCALLFYLIFITQKSVIGYNANRIAYYIQSFPYLRNLYTKKGNIYSKDFGNIIIKYNIKLLQLLEIYISWTIPNNNIIKRSFSFPELPSDYSNRINLKPTKLFPSSIYIEVEYMVNPIETAFEILTRYLRNGVYDITIYECDKCGEIMDNKKTLCSGCRIELGNIYINQYKEKIAKLEKSKAKTNNNKTKEEYEERIASIKNELKCINNNEFDNNSKSSKIVEIYIKHRDVNNSRRKNKKVIT